LLTKTVCSPEGLDVLNLKAKSAAIPAALTLALLAADGLARADAPQPEIPTCDKKIGTLAVTEPQNQWWLQYNLESPEALIKVYVSKSKCFTLVDRGKGLAAAQAERSLAGSGEMRGGSNIGKGQMKAADYVLVPDIAMKNNDSGGKKIGGMLGGLLPGIAGVVAGGVSMKSKTADVVLTLTDVRSTEQVALEQGHYKKTDLGWAGGGAGFFGAFAAAGASSYANTEIGQVVDCLPRLLHEARERRQVDGPRCQDGQRAAVRDHGQAGQVVRSGEQQVQGDPRPRSGHDAVSHR
jgi:curli biogenesis system outer membrane secretion channel CsgG